MAAASKVPGWDCSKCKYKNRDGFLFCANPRCGSPRFPALVQAGCWVGGAQEGGTEHADVHVPVPYMTTRSLVPTLRNNESPLNEDTGASACWQDHHFFYGAEPHDTLNFGLGQVLIPSKHRFGRVDAPWYLSCLVFLGLASDKESLSISYCGATTEDGFGMVCKHLLKTASQKDALLFVHGYNVSFSQALRRTAQIFWDMQFPGIPVCYSWPSAEKTKAYPEDSKVVASHQQPLFLAQAIETLASKIDGKIHILAHSMGNQIFTRALGYANVRKLASEGRIGTMISAAPDVAKESFVERCLQFTLSLPKPIGLPFVVYTCPNDKALKASKKVNSSIAHSEERFGGSPTAIEAVKIVDVASHSFLSLNHSYVYEAPEVVEAIRLLLTAK